MEDINKIIVIGRLTGDTVLTEINKKDGATTHKLRLSIAVNRYTRESEESKADFFNVDVWGKHGESLQFLKKGMRVCVEGRMEIDQQKEIQNGQTIYKIFPSIRAN